MTKIDLSGRVALVSGASRGIGRGIALALAEAGADIAVNYQRHADQADETVAAVRAMGRRAHAYAASVTDEADCLAMMDAIGGDFGGLSILINNAGIASRGNVVAETDTAEVDRLMAVHAMGPHRLSRLALPHLRRHARSDIIVISSVATLTNQARAAPYNMAKAAGEALAMTLAKEELANGVRVNIVAPALTVSDMGERLAHAITGEADIHHLDAVFPFGRVALPADVAAAVVWLVSDANPYCSGQKLNIDGAAQANFR